MSADEPCNRAEPFISIVTVSLNAATTIEDTIASVAMQQTRFAVEHICVDGGSTDGTRLIIDRWALRYERIQRIYESDGGIYDAMNKGLRIARGEYVLFLNADDFLVAANTLDVVMQGLTPGSSLNPDLIVGRCVHGNSGAARSLETSASSPDPRSIAGLWPIPGAPGTIHEAQPARWNRRLRS